MATRNTEILVGVTVLAALAGVIWSVTALREVRIAESTQRWTARFRDVGGLAEEDPVTSDVINRLIRRAQKELGAAAVVVTHDMASARFIGDRIALLHQGRIVFDGTPADIDRATDPVVRQFVEGKSDESLVGGG